VEAVFCVEEFPLDIVPSLLFSLLPLGTLYHSSDWVVSSSEAFIYIHTIFSSLNRVI
jgi:hypothetical protein